MKTKVWQYGKSPNPKDWQEASDALKSLQKAKRKSNTFTEKLDSIEKLLKDHK